MTATSAASNPYTGSTLYTVVTPTGVNLNLMTLEEAEHYERQRDAYLTHNVFTNASDVNDLDRLLQFEIMIYRWSVWLSQGFDYIHALVDAGTLNDNIKKFSTEIRLIKASLGIDKSTRDKEKGEALPDYIGKLLERAQVFGYHRNEQYEMAVTKLYQLRSMVMTYDRCDEEERALLDLSYESIFAWIRDTCLRDWDDLDTKFRAEQKMWIRSM